MSKPEKKIKWSNRANYKTSQNFSCHDPSIQVYELITKLKVGFLKLKLHFFSWAMNMFYWVEPFKQFGLSLEV